MLSKSFLKSPIVESRLGAALSSASGAALAGGFKVVSRPSAADPSVFRAVGRKHQVSALGYKPGPYTAPHNSPTASSPTPGAFI